MAVAAPAQAGTKGPKKAKDNPVFEAGTVCRRCGQREGEQPIGRLAATEISEFAVRIYAGSRFLCRTTSTSWVQPNAATFLNHVVNDSTTSDRAMPHPCGCSPL